jgi:hypothetical protein
MVWDLLLSLHKANLRKNVLLCVCFFISYVYWCCFYLFHAIVAKGTFPISYRKTKMLPKGSFEVKYEILMENELRSTGFTIYIVMHPILQIFFFCFHLSWSVLVPKFFFFAL